MLFVLLCSIVVLFNFFLFLLFLSLGDEIKLLIIYSVKLVLSIKQFFHCVSYILRTKYRSSLISCTLQAELFHSRLYTVNHIAHILLFQAR